MEVEYLAGRGKRSFSTSSTWEKLFNQLISWLLNQPRQHISAEDTEMAVPPASVE